jgi:hypothetical protein
MEPIEKKHLRRMSCPKCQKTKLHFERAAGGGEPPPGPQRKLRCDACKSQFLEGDAAIQTEMRSVLADMTPPPVAVHR